MVVAYLNVTSWHFSGAPEESHDKSQLQWSVCQMKFKADISRTRTRNVYPDDGGSLFNRNGGTQRPYYRPPSDFHCQEAEFGPQTWCWFISKDRHHDLVQPNGDLCKYEAGSRNWTRQYSPNLPDNTSSSLKQKYKHCEVYVQNAETQKLQSFTEYNRNGIQQERNTTGTHCKRH